MKISVICPNCKTSLQVSNELYDPLLPEKAKQYAKRFSEEGDAKASTLAPSGLDDLNSFAIVERFYEYAFVIETLLKNARSGMKILDVGSARTVLASVMAKLGNYVTCTDFQKTGNMALDNINYVQCDIIKGSADLKTEHFDFVTCVSTIEHVGLGRWNDPEDVSGDIKGMRTIHSLLKVGGLLALTLPIGIAEVVFPAHRVYNKSRLNKLFEEFMVKESLFYRMEKSDQDFVKCEESAAFGFGRDGSNYNLGCYLLEKI